MLASIAIPVLNGIDDTRACLESIERHTPEPHELLLVDNGSTDGTADLLRSHAAGRPSVRVVTNHENRGFAAAVNQALALATGRYVVLLNNDTLVTDGWLAGLVSALDHCPGAGIAGPVSNNVAPPQRIPAEYSSEEELAAFAARVAREGGEPHHVRRVVGFCLLAKREVVEAIGALDERFGAGNYEDDDWCLRATAAGFDTVLAPGVFVHHAGGRTFSAQRIDHAAAMVRNARLFELKWECRIDAWRGRGAAAIEPEVLATNMFLPLPPPVCDNDELPPPTPIEAGGELRLERFLTRGRRVALAGGAEAVGRAFREPLRWRDPQRSYEAVRRLCQVALDTGTELRGSAWVELYAAAADALAEILEREPAEPVLLNAAGVFLHELTHHEAAAAVFERALALDPSLPAAESNLVWARAAAEREDRLERPQDGELARRLRAAAERAHPAIGLTVSLCMIVKDEEQLLPACLASARRAVDEIVVVDTGSTDRTVEIAERFGAKVLHFPWSGSFADARNAGLEAASGDWLLFLDADERLIDGAAGIRELLGRTWREGFFFEVRNLTGGPGTGSTVVHPALRLFRNRPEYRFEGRIHEQISRLMPTYLPERFESTAVRVLHLGYLDRIVAAREKSGRNLALLELEAQEAPSPYVSFNLGGEYQRLGEWPAAARHFDRAWSAVRDDDEWPSIGFAPVLALRTARAYRECGRTEDARKVLEHALGRLPGYTDLFFELALCAIAVGDRDEAEQLLERCLELGDSPPGLASTVGAGSFLAGALLSRLRQERDRAQAV